MGGGGIWHSQGCVWGVHGFVTDKEGNLYTAEVRTGRVQKHTPRKGAIRRFWREAVALGVGPVPVAMSQIVCSEVML